MSSTDSPRQLAPTGFFGWRTPMLPVDAWIAWNEGLALPAALRRGDATALATALDHDRELLRQRLRDWAARPLVREAIFLASPGFEARLSRWLAESPSSSEGDGLAVALSRYLARMSTRSTPFGLFATHSLGRMGERTRLILTDERRCRRRTSLDMEYLAGLASAIEADPVMRQSLRYRPNNTLYPAGEQFRYVEWKADGRTRHYHLVAVDASSALDTVLAAARDGATIDELAGLLVGPGVTKAQAAGFVGALADSRILISDLEPMLTGAEVIDDWLDKAGRGGGLGEIVGLLGRVRDALRELDRGETEATPDRYRAIGERLKALPPRPDEGHLFQVDAVRRTSQATLGRAVVADLVKAIRLLHRITDARQGRLAEFAKAFEQRYEEREVGLMEALDEELGVGFGTRRSLASEAEPLIRDLDFPATDAALGQNWTARDGYLLRRCQECWRSGDTVLELIETDLMNLEPATRRPLPDALAVLCSVIGDQQDIDGGTYQVFVDSIAGPSGAQLLGRFCHADEELMAAVVGHLRQEEALRPEAVFAEIVCQPEDRVGNVLSRPLLRGHEIPYLGRSGAPAERQIPVGDLRVALRDGRIVLRSARLGREVIPRLSNAHNIAHPKNPGVYRFLAALQGQGVVSSLAWNWGPLEDAGFLPRVTFGRIVLARARWRVTGDEFESFAGLDGPQRYRRFHEWRMRRLLPRHVVLADDDNELLLDLDNVYCADSLLGRSGRSLVLLEWLQSSCRLAARGSDGLYCHELVVPFLCRTVPAQAPPPQDAGASRAIERRQRSFPPGSEWLYVKLYCGEASSDLILRRLVLPLSRQALAEGIACRWFYVRYADPDHHLRWRLQGDPPGLAGLLTRLSIDASPWMASNHLTRVELATYEREIERYGGVAGVQLAEELFYRDSVAAADIIARYHGDRGREARWRLAVLALDRLLADFSLDIGARVDLISRLRDRYARELKVDSLLRRQIGAKLRRERRGLLDLLVADPASGHVLHAGAVSLRTRSGAIAPLVGRLSTPGTLVGLSVEDALESYLHMTANRMLRSAPRAQEYVLYDLLAALYRNLAHVDGHAG
ncbi:MAG: lantibiotic dehydratase [Burkholderiales bacterium]|nr:lantibiotic dehydratase [Burkholderiales bacterium]